MATAQEQMLAAAVVFGVVLLLMLYNVLRPVRAPVATAPATRPTGSMVAKFVTHEGSVVGEVVAVEEDRLVLKQGGRFRVVPASQAHDEGGEVRLTGPIDWAAADTAGALWHGQNRKAPEAEVTGGTLTTSADVRSPALDAFQREKTPSSGVQADGAADSGPGSSASDPSGKTPPGA